MSLSNWLFLRFLYFFNNFFLQLTLFLYNPVIELHNVRLRFQTFNEAVVSLKTQLVIVEKTELVGLFERQKTDYTTHSGLPEMIHLLSPCLWFQLTLSPTV